MIIKHNKTEYDVNDCTYKERRELHRMNAKVWAKGEMDIDLYYLLLERVGEIAGIEAELESMTMPKVDKLLQSIYIEYINISPKKAGG
jgi:hypothetical protein